MLDVKAILDKLMDENDWEPIEIVNSRGESARFNPIALLPTTVESQKYVDETVEHNFAILQPLDENGEEIGNPLVVDITVDEDGNYALIVVEKRELISEIMGEYREVRGITPDDLADAETETEDESDEDGEAESDQSEEVNETDETEESDKTDQSEPSEDPDPAEKSEKKGFFARLFGKKDGQ